MWNDLKSYVLSLLYPVRDEQGQAMVEYGLILALVSVIAVGVLATIGLDVLGAFKEVTEAF